MARSPSISQLRSSRLPPAFFAQDTVDVARMLLGQFLVHETGDGLLVGRVTETEAYCAHEPACHAYGNYRRRDAENWCPTGRSAVLFGPPGHAYVYLNYGIHWLFNVVTEESGVGGAVLIRAVEPLQGVDLMRARRPAAKTSADLTNGPGKLTQAMRIGPEHNQANLERGPLYFSRGPGTEISINQSPRIGITKATDLEWRFFIISK